MNDNKRDTLTQETSDEKPTTSRGDIIQDLDQPENLNIDELIEHLPENFPAAAETIIEELTPLPKENL